MWWLAAGLTLLSAYGSYRTSKAQSAAAAEGLAISRENAKLKEKQNVEAERRAKKEQVAVEAEAKARAYASGAKGDSTNFNQVRASITAEHEKQFEWLQWSGEKSVEMILRTGEYQKQIGDAQAEASMWNAVGQVGKAAGYAYTGLAQPTDPITVGSTTYESQLTSPLISTSVPTYNSNEPFTGFNPFYNKTGFALSPSGF